MKPLYITTIICLALAFMASCSDDDDTTNMPHVETIEVLETENNTIKILKGEEYTLKIATKPAGSSVRYYGTSPNVFRVNQNTGHITTIAGGTGTINIVAPKGDSWTKTTVNVFVEEYVEKITVKEDQRLRILPTNATASVKNDFVIENRTATNHKLSFTSSDPGIVTVDEDGKLTYVSKGVAQITAKAMDALAVESEPITVYSGYAETKLSKSGWVATASSTQPGNYHTYRIIDNSDATFWHSSWNDPQPFPYYALIDMKEVRNFSKIILTRRASYADNRDMEYYISDVATDGLSADDPSFKRIAEFTYGDEPASVRKKTFNVFPEAFQSRYLKIVMLNSNRNLGDMSIAEVDVYVIE